MQGGSSLGGGSGHSKGSRGGPEVLGGKPEKTGPVLGGAELPHGRVQGIKLECVEVQSFQVPITSIGAT